MTKRIFKAICTASSTVFVVTMVLILGVLYNYFSSVQLNQLKTETILAAKGVEISGIDFVEDLNDSNYRITWVSADGSVIFDSSSSTDLMENHLQREEIREALSEGMGESSRYSSTLMKRSLYCAQKLSDGTVLRLSISHQSVLFLVFGMLQPILIVIVVAVAASFILANSLSRRIVEPMNRLNLDEPMSNDGYEELAPLLNRIQRQQSELSRMDRALKEKEEKLEKLESIRREFTANVSHELKTPLHAISGYSELLKCGIVQSEDIGLFSEKIYDETQRLISLVEDIINLSHLDEGGKDYQWTDVDLYECSEKVVQNLSEIATKGSVSLSIKGEHHTVNGVPELIHGIIYNLCDNAIKYNRPGGSVVICISDHKIAVEDTGIGIPQEDVDRIFERFYRVDKSRSKEVGGTGLGLSIVKHAAMIQNAKISVKSEVNQGSVITVEFDKEKNTDEE